YWFMQIFHIILSDLCLAGIQLNGLLMFELYPTFLYLLYIYPKKLDNLIILSILLGCCIFWILLFLLTLGDRTEIKGVANYFNFSLGYIFVCLSSNVFLTI
ncbi:hypothetical protein ACJX0J_010281, partial [Zea mays]